MTQLILTVLTPTKIRVVTHRVKCAIGTQFCWAPVAQSGSQAGLVSPAGVYIRPGKGALFSGFAFPLQRRDVSGHTRIMKGLEFSPQG